MSGRTKTQMKSTKQRAELGRKLAEAVLNQAGDGLDRTDYILGLAREIIPAEDTEGDSIMAKSEKIKIADEEARQIERRHPNVWDYKNRCWRNPCCRMNLARM
ncbi:MAG: hypothetical protein ACYTEQ_05700 [Planctomycetota bacterium]